MAPRRRAARLERATKRQRLESRAKAKAVLTSLTFPLALHQRTKDAATRLNWTMSEVVRVAVEQWLDQHKDALRAGARR